MKIIDYIKTKRREWRHRRWFESFLKNGTDVSLQDAINNLPHPKNRTLRILCTGGDLVKELTEIDSDCDYLVVNFFVNSDLYQKIKPRVYVLADNAFFENYQSTTEKILEKTTWSMYLIIPCKQKLDDEFRNNKYVHVVEINDVAYAGPREYRDYCFDHNLALPAVFNVLQMALYCAIYMRYEKIELYGVSHDWIKYTEVGEDNHLYRCEPHFYDNGKPKRILMQQPDGSYHKLHEMLYEYATIFMKYWEYKELAERRNCKIINCTKGSYIDAFERKV